MIQKITISNFFSIREPLEVSFEASKEKQYGEDWIVRRGNVKLLKALLLYGANGSGKTNILCALDFLRNLIISVPKDVDVPLGYMPFALDSESKNKETYFDLYFFIGEERFRYLITLNCQRIISEELRIYTTGNNSKTVFTRKYNDDKGISVVRFGSWLDLTSSQRKTIEDATTKNISVLAAYSTKNISSGMLDKIRNYFKSNFFRLYYLQDADQEVARAVKTDGNLKSLLIELLKSFHSNIVDIKVEEECQPIPEEARQMLMQLKSSEEEKEQILRMTSLTKLTSCYIHENAYGRFSLEDSLQSEGTRSFIRHLVLFYQAIQNGWLMCLDEFGVGMQAKTQNLLLDFFLKFSNDSQILVATQSLGFLDYKSMRRDAINIISKDEIGQSRNDSKTVRSIHKNIKLRRAYSDGRFTTIDPNEPELDFNMERERFQSFIKKEREEVIMKN